MCIIFSFLGKIRSQQSGGPLCEQIERDRHMKISGFADLG